MRPGRHWAGEIGKPGLPPDPAYRRSSARNLTKSHFEPRVTLTLSRDCILLHYYSTTTLLLLHFPSAPVPYNPTAAPLAAHWATGGTRFLLHLSPAPVHSPQHMSLLLSHFHHTCPPLLLPFYSPSTSPRFLFTSGLLLYRETINELKPGGVWAPSRSAAGSARRRPDSRGSVRIGPFHCYASSGRVRKRFSRSNSASSSRSKARLAGRAFGKPRSAVSSPAL